MKPIQSIAPICALALLAGCASLSEPRWQTIFDGETLAGWKPKITGEALGEDSLGTFSVQDGAIHADYDRYDEFGGRFGLLFYEREVSDYRLRFEYRFIGEQVAGGPEWALLNSGAMLHSQAPETLALQADAPISVEAQLLGSHPAETQRTTGNVCTPGTRVSFGGTERNDHCMASIIVAKPVGEWTLFEADVRGGTSMRFYIDGELAFELTDPVIDHDDLWGAGYRSDGEPLTSGYIALQAESHGVEFRNIQLLDRNPVD